MDEIEDSTLCTTLFLEGPMKHVSRRGPGFKEEEDNTLIASWLSIDKDVVHGSDQTNSAFWKRIHDEYHQRKAPCLPDRKERSLNMRWQDIQKEVNLFCAALAKVESGQCSGMNEQDKINEAKVIYKKLSKKKKKDFHLMHCWEDLRDEPKWKLQTQGAQSTNTRPHSTSAPNVIELDDEQVASSQMERPLGQKAEKERQKRRKGNGTDVDDISLLDRIDKSQNEKKALHEQTFAMMPVESRKTEESTRINKDRFDLEKEKLDLEKEKFHLEKEKFDLEKAKVDLEKRKFEWKEQSEKRKERIAKEREEENIMKVNTTGMNDRLKAYWETRQEEILKMRELK